MSFLLISIFILFIVSFIGFFICVFMQLEEKGKEFCIMAF
jgi:hypothetical protein